MVRTFFAGAPDDLATALRDPEWVRSVTEATAPLLAPDFEFVTVRDSVGMPGERSGLAAFFAAYETYSDMWDSFRLVPERFVEVGDKVVVEAKLGGIVRHGGVPLEQTVAAVYTFEDGKIRRIEEFSDVASAHAAAEG
jgi:ketosteroid isomerase-like protein